MDFIPLLRFMLKLAIKEKITGKSQDTIKLELSKNNIIEYFLNAEIKQKTGFNFSKSYLYGLKNFHL
jgi:hypothetical protein